MNRPSVGAVLRFARTYPVGVTATIQALLALVVAAGFSGLKPGVSGAVLAATSAALTLAAALNVRPFPTAALTGAITALGTLLIAFDVPHVTTGLVAAANFFAVAILGLVLHLSEKMTTLEAKRHPQGPG